MQCHNSTLWATLLQFVAFFFKLQSPDLRVPVQTTQWQVEYDYIVVGAGSAGSVVAARLSELENQQVLLMEAGGTENLLTDIPAIANEWKMSPIDWDYRTEPQGFSCFGNVERRSPWARGKVLGGSSVINAMIYTRGNAHDYDRYAAEGANGWSFRELLPYFLRLEDNTDPEVNKTNGYHAQGGPLTISAQPDPSLLAQALPEAGRHLGYTNDDLNGPTQAAFVIAQGNTRNGSRCSSARAYLQPSSGARGQNLTVLLHSVATRIIFNNEQRAIGVEFQQQDGVSHVVYARKEIILSGGTIQSAKLLMLSGIGPRDHLEELGIPVIKDAPVGQNLQEHVGSGGAHFTISHDAAPENPYTSRSLSRYFNQGRGPLTALRAESVAFVKTKYANQSEDWPDVALQMIGGSPSTNVGEPTRRIQLLSDEMWQQVFAPYVNANTFSIYTLLLRPKSRGYLKLRSADPLDKPIIDPNYLSDEDDVKVLVEAMKLAIAAGLSPAYAQYNSTLFETVYPGCEIFEMWTDEYIACVIRTYTVHNYHAVGTCRMGAPEDPRSIVDPQLRVIGVRNLRVMDLSVLPHIVTGNTNVPAMMIGEKGADLIKGQSLPPANLTSDAPLLVDFERQESVKNEAIRILREQYSRQPVRLEPFGQPIEQTSSAANDEL